MSTAISSGMHEKIRSARYWIQRGRVMALRARIMNGLACTLLLAVSTMPGPAYSVDPDDEVLAYFSSDYQEARARFLEAAHARGLKEESFKLPETGPDGRDLYMDVVTIGSMPASTVLVIASGIHGVEGFAGSAIQTGLLRQDVFARLDSGVAVLLLHAVNPYGFAHVRRFNEDNIDLNRNFIDHISVSPVNEGYEKLAEAIAPRSLSRWSFLRARLRLLLYRLVNGKTELQHAISSGQYTHPEGLFFGGNAPSWTNRRLTEIAHRYLATAHRVVFIDIHTGLGVYGEVEMIANYSRGSPQYGRAKAWWGQRVRTPQTGESVSVPLHGTLNQALEILLAGNDLLAVAMEFGTRPLKEVFLALRTENWLHHHGGMDHPDAAKIKQELLRVFYPPEDEWKQAVWRQGRDIITQALDNLQR